MAIENKRMQQRYGTYEEFQENKRSLLPNEIASVISGDPSSRNGKSLHFSFGSNDVRKIMTEEDAIDLIETNTASLEEIKEYIK